jgi:hypothetical protein
MRIGFAAFSSALALGRSPNPIAPPATAESLINLLLVVDIMESESMIGVVGKCNRRIDPGTRHEQLSLTPLRQARWNQAMGNLTGGLISGLIFGAVVVGTMLPMQFPDKTTALIAAFISRFGLGLVIGCVQLPWPGWLIGLVFGLLLSIPDALITKAYAPILIIGSVGGLIIGGILHGWK